MVQRQKKDIFVLKTQSVTLKNVNATLVLKEMAKPAPNLKTLLKTLFKTLILNYAVKMPNATLLAIPTLVNVKKDSKVTVKLVINRLMSA